MTLRPLMCRRRRRAAGDEGIAMIMVMGTILVLTLLLAAALSYAMQVQPQARRDQDWNAALASAQAGVDDYVAHLNAMDNYWQTVDCANTALAGPVTGTNSCGWTASTPPGWRLVQLGNPKGGSFHYDVDPSPLASQGVVRVFSTGKVGKSSRTVQVNVSRGGPTSFLYYTDFEDADPGNTTAYGAAGADTNSCGRGGSTLADYYWANNTRGATAGSVAGESSANGGPNGGCVEITFINGDVLDGRAHFNDTPLISGNPKFLKGFEMSDLACKTVPANCWRGSGTPDVNGIPTIYFAKLDLVDNSAAFATYPGCVYTGDTRIKFKSDGTMDVWNTKSAGTSLVGPGSPSGTSCGTASGFSPSSGSDPTPSGKQNVPVPNDLVIYVKNSAGTTSCEPGQVVNGGASGSSSGDVIPMAATSAVTNRSTVSDVSFFDPDTLVTTQSQTFSRPSTSSGWSPGALTQATGSPSPTGDDHPQTFDCGSGNVYVEGTVKGRVTIAAQNNVVVTGDLQVEGVTPPSAASGTSMVGLVAANSVVVYHPVHRASNEATAVSRTSGAGTCASGVGGTPSTSSGNGTGMTCKWATTETFLNSGSDYTSLSYPGLTSSGQRRYIYGSIQTLQHSFYVQNYNKGATLGQLSVRGSIAQRWRGIVGTGGGGTTGFVKDYSYDTRLVFSGPPYFPQWTNSVWKARTTGELKPAY